MIGLIPLHSLKLILSLPQSDPSDLLYVSCGVTGLLPLHIFLPYPVLPGLSSASGGCTAAPGQQSCPLARRDLASIASQREHARVLSALCLSTQGGERPPADPAGVRLGAHSQAHRYKKAWGGCPSHCG